MGLRSLLVVLLLALLGGFAHASGDERADSACLQASAEQCADPRGTDMQAAGAGCVIACAASPCIASSQGGLQFRTAAARPSTLLPLQVTKHYRAPDTAPPRPSFA